MATYNSNKAREIQAILAAEMPGVFLRFLTLAHFPAIGDVEETGNTFEENAVKKARFFAAKTGLICLADDSGLEVDALRGLPGVRSARFASRDSKNATDAENRKRVLSLLESVPHENRTARFKCAVALAAPEGTTEVKEGVVEGYILKEERGHGGFGYDPIFFYPPLGKTFAELDPREKNAVSHRASALRAMVPVIMKIIEKFPDP